MTLFRKSVGVSSLMLAVASLVFALLNANV